MCYVFQLTGLALHQHAVFLGLSGEVYTCGRGWDGRLGHGDELDVLEPTLVETLVGASICHVTAGLRHSVAVSSTGVAHSFGAGDSGELGHGNQKKQLVSV
jgi:RCC1 and BTB domain-containing protein